MSLNFVKYNCKKCELCQSSDYITLIDGYNHSFLSDSTSANVALHKIMCSHCGLIRNGQSFDIDFLEKHYREGYKLGSDAAIAEPIMMTSNGPLTRSEVMFLLIKKSLAECAIDIEKIGSVLEVGCGEGSLLNRFKNKHVEGIEPNSNSVKVAQKAGLNVNAGGFEIVSRKYDLIYAIAVFEHVPSPSYFFEKLKAHLNQEGVIFLCQPCQDDVSNDIFFSDHLYHFNSEHIAQFAQQAGFTEVFRTNKPENVKYFSAHVLQLTNESDEEKISFNPNRNEKVLETIKFYNQKFEEINTIVKFKKVVVWGVGQTFQFFSTYSNLTDSDILFAIDDNLSRYKNVGYKFQIFHSDNAIPMLTSEHEILFTFQPLQVLQDLLKNKNITYHILTS